MILFQLGFDHYVPIEKIKVILPYESTRVKKDIIALREEAGTGKLIDATKPLLCWMTAPLSFVHIRRKLLQNDIRRHREGIYEPG